MMSPMTRRMVLAATLGLLALDNTASATVYYTNYNTTTAGYEIWSMHDDGTQPSRLFASNFSDSPYAGLQASRLTAGKFLTAKQTGLIPSGRFGIAYGELFTFVQDGLGGATFTPITDFAAHGWVIYIGGNQSPQFSNDGQDSFVSTTVYDQNTGTIKIVRVFLGTLTAPAIPADAQVVHETTATSTTPIQESALNLAWSPAGDQFVYSKPDFSNNGYRKLILVTVATGAQVVLGDEATHPAIGYSAPQWSPVRNSHTVAFSSSDIFTIDVNTTVTTKVLTRDSTNRDFAAPSWSPDGTLLSFFLADASSNSPWSPSKYDIGKASSTFAKKQVVTNLTAKTMPVLTTGGRYVIGWR
jgi:hypothetical protein